MKNRNAFEGIVLMRCPKCRKGKMFPDGTLYTARFMKMNDQCSCCGQSFTPEPGYYYGAMFVSYAINTAFFVAVWLSMSLFTTEISLTSMIVALLVVIFGLLPVTFRLSRILWIYIFIRYEGSHNVEHFQRHV